MRKVLFITYYFPPSGGSGVQRPLKFVKYLREFGWDPLVLTVDPAHASFPDLDSGLQSDVPPDIRVIRTKSWDPYAAYARFLGKQKSESVGIGFLGAEHASFREKFARWLRANLFLPDARIGWVRYARAAGLEAIRSGEIDAIVSTGPPHSCHLVGSYLSRHTTLPWIADLRDAWPDVAYADLLPTTGLARRMEIAIRDRVLERASVCIAVTDDLARAMTVAVGRSFKIIRNGFDPAEFSHAPRLSTDLFSIVHTGNMVPARNPGTLWSVLADAESKKRWPRLRVRLVGNVDSSVWESAANAGVLDCIEHVPYVPHAEAIGHTIGASILLLPINRVSVAAGIVTGKIYEYLASGRPVLGLGDPDGEAATILHRTAGGQMFAYDDTESVASFIDTHYSAFEAGSPLQGASQQSAAPFSRRTQTGELAQLLNSICDP